jgi:hypothetical protein
MNSLSWLIYLADVTGSLDSACTGTLIAMGVVGGLSLIFGPLIAMELDIDDLAGLVRKAIKTGVIVAAVLLSIIVITPSQNTIYAIAASELGEEVLKSSTATKAQKALDAWLDKQIGEIKPEKSE